MSARLPIEKLTHSDPPAWSGPWPWESDGSSARFNIASYLPARAVERPDGPAVVMPEGYNGLGKRCYSHLTFSQLDRLCDAYAHGLRAQGFARGDRVLLMVRQGLELIALTFALFKLGCVPVLIDPGMGRKGFLRCVESCAPSRMVGIPLAHTAKILFRGAFESVETAVITEPRWYSGAPALSRIADFEAGPFEPVDTGRDELAAILYTSGSTGPPKGVLYTHGIFDGQVGAIGEMYGVEAGEACVPGFPLFALFSVALGMRCVIPDMDPSKPAEVDPANLVEAIRDFGATMAFGSPAIWVAVARFCEAKGLTLPSITRLLTFGAPISPLLMERYTRILPNGSIHTPYGATESLPVASISSDEVLAETAEASKEGRGMCVGRPIERATVRLLRITDEAIPSWDAAEEVAPGEIGEITVRGPNVTQGYDRRPEHDRLSKIAPGVEDESPTLWHRMGDVGYLDEQGRLWFCGRKAHRVETVQGTMFSVPCEAIFNNHPRVYRSALVGLGPRGQQVPAIVVEPEPGQFPDGAQAEAAFREELLALGRANELTRGIERIYFHRAFPVDKRHNAKIHREELAEWVGRMVV